jgi:ABC-2 type transport system permease protein
VVSFIDKTLIVAELEVRKLRYDAADLITRAVQPALWLSVFGEVFTQVHAIPTGSCASSTLLPWVSPRRAYSLR